MRGLAVRNIDVSVLKSKRDVSAVQYVETARELLIFTLQKCLKFPKRYTFFITTEIVRLAQDVFNCVKSANSIFVTNAHELQLRRDYLTKANCALQCLISHLDIAKSVIGSNDIKSESWKRWMDFIELEAKLIAAVKKSDKERHSKFAHQQS